MKTLKFLFTFVVCFSLQYSIGQTIEWKYLETGATNGSCTSNTDCLTNSLCFGIEYTPGVSGTVTSYTLGFTGTCINDMMPTINASSCTMSDNTTTFDGCDLASLFLLQASGNNGNISVTAGVPVILHQVCIDLGMNGVSTIAEETTTGLSVSIDSAGTNNPITDLPSFAGFEANTGFCVSVSCLDSMVCSLDFGQQNKLLFDTLVGGFIAESSSLANSLPASQSFDIYDEFNELCDMPGGFEDVTFTFQTINTVDLNNLGVIDTLGGVEQNIIQTAGGLVGSLPFGSSVNSESSTGDSRGYSITVEFASHIGIVADQITVGLAGMNSAGEAFETARLTFLDSGLNPYSAPAYLGFYNDTTDLSGNCMATPKVMPWDTAGVGTVLFQDTSTVDLADPCNPIAGSSTQDTVYIRATTDAGLDSADVVRGFLLTVIGEDVAAPPVLDDGTEGDGVPGNANTNTSATLTSTLLGYYIDGCVFNNIALSVDLLNFSLKKEGQKALLTWTTANEFNHNYFGVEWSSDGKKFVEVGRVFGENNNGPINNYSFYHDETLPGKNYYRLRKVDFDGRFEYSEIKSVRFDGIYNGGLLIYPNPTSNLLNIAVSDSFEVDIPAEVYTIEGVRVSTFLLKKGSRQSSLDISDLPRGTYFLKIGRTVRKFVAIE